MSNTSKSFWGYFIDIATLVAMVVLYSKTMEVMAAIAPVTLFGVTGLSLIYGAVVATLIEGTIIAISFIPAFKHNPSAQAYMWFLFGISAFCQFMDKTIVIDQMQNMTAYTEVWVTLTYAIPVFIALGLIVVAQSNQKYAGDSKPSNWKGARNLFKGTFTKFMDGVDSESNSAPATPNTVATALDVPQIELETETKEEKPATNRKVRHE